MTSLSPRITPFTHYLGLVSPVTRLEHGSDALEQITTILRTSGKRHSEHQNAPRWRANATPMVRPELNGMVPRTTDTPSGPTLNLYRRTAQDSIMVYDDKKTRA